MSHQDCSLKDPNPSKSSIKQVQDPEGLLFVPVSEVKLCPDMSRSLKRQARVHVMLKALGCWPKTSGSCRTRHDRTKRRFHCQEQTRKKSDPKESRVQKTCIQESKSMQFEASEKQWKSAAAVQLETGWASAQWLAQWSTLHLITRTCSKEPGSSTTSQDFQAESPLEMQLQICKALISTLVLFSSLFISKIRWLGQWTKYCVLNGSAPDILKGRRPSLAGWGETTSTSEKMGSTWINQYQTNQ